MYMLFALVVVVTTAQLVYLDENNPVTSTQNKDDREPFSAPELCPENQQFYPGDQGNDSVCDCAPSFIYYPPMDKCYHVYKQGPCNPDEHLILKTPDSPECVRNPCRNDTMVPFEGKCVRLYSADGCPPSHFGGGILQVNETSLQLECIPSYDDAFLFQVPYANCPAGSKRSANGQCRNQFLKV